MNQYEKPVMILEKIEDEVYTQTMLPDDITPPAVVSAEITTATGQQTNLAGRT